MELRQFVATLRARWRFIAISLVVGMGLTFLIAMIATPQYESHAKLFVTSTSTSETDLFANLYIGQRVSSYADLAVEPGVMQKVADSLGLTESATDLAGKANAEVIGQTQTLLLSITADDPKLAQQIAEGWSRQVIDLVAELEAQEAEDGTPAVVARVAADPSYNSTAVAPNIPLHAAVGLLLSVLVGVAAAMLADVLDRTVKSRSDAENTAGHPVIATLPYESNVRQSPLISETAGPLAEAFRVLRTNLQFANLDADRQVILVTSAMAEEGKTLTATNLALSMAQSGKSVLLVDADMRNPSVARRLGLENGVGILTILVGRATADTAIQSHPSGIDFLASGPTPPNPAEVLDTNAMRDLLAELRDGYDTVIVDAPPLLPVADSSILIGDVDGVLLLTRYGSTTREHLRLAVARVEAVGGKLFGVVLNRTPGSKAEGYGYGYGYGYGSQQVERSFMDRLLGRAPRSR